ncbi:hypothetical protein [Planomonospora parontospora]|uniref:hypothetical protein n=1 Tax=Planomonospora parontospora TaxID=58119 RepID=UPI00199C7254|nr:hypothetical protein [Planomonospora parontospora]GGL51185.1 hypothetical protein GCM10014719_60590 [Planomonospora parontospora subsp. antibiotica]GII19076.1 hypothetical protein Ppa05_58020 [Planomonospora parontospora subsp. antibiotica]
MRGPIYDASVGGLTAWTLGSSLALIGGLISILLVIRHTRVEEETGRRELLASGVIRRRPVVGAGVDRGVRRRPDGGRVRAFHAAGRSKRPDLRPPRTRPGPATGTLRGAFGLAARLHRGTLAGFAIGFGALGALLGLFLAVDLLAEFKLATGVILELSPFVHVPALLLDGASSPVAPLLGLTVVAIALTAAGLAFLRRRDLVPSA